MVSNKSFSADRVLVACVAENRPPYAQETVCLFSSLAACGGRLAEAQKLAYFVESVEGPIAEELARLGVTVKVVERLSDIVPHANKIRMLDESEDFDHLVALDTDVVIGRDFSEMVCGSAVRAKPVDDDPLTLEAWQQIFEHFRVILPEARFLTTFSLKETIAYFNSGVLIIPRSHVGTLARSWERFIWELVDAYEVLPDLAEQRFFTDQFALSLALADNRIPFLPLPIEMNFPTHFPIHQAYRPNKICPYVLHHHHRLSVFGELLPSGYEEPDQRIAAINNILRAKTGTKRTSGTKSGGIGNGAQFWESRYVHNPDLGSGVGSRGANLSYKAKVLQKIVDEYSPSSILDIGCGDIEVVKDLQFAARYVGADLSHSVIERNKSVRPNWVFLEGDIRALPSDISADLVICLDVLIHAPTFEDYQSMLGELLERSSGICLISAYESRPRDRFSSEITAYYEPITLTLRRFGVERARIIGSYRDTCLILAEGKYVAN